LPVSLPCFRLKKSFVASLLYVLVLLLLHLHFRAYMVTTIDEDDVAQWSIVSGHVSSQVQVFSTFVKAFNWFLYFICPSMFAFEICLWLLWKEKDVFGWIRLAWFWLKTFFHRTVQRFCIKTRRVDIGCDHIHCMLILGSILGLIVYSFTHGFGQLRIKCKKVSIYIPTHDGKMTILDGFNEIVTLIPRSEILAQGWNKMFGYGNRRENIGSALSWNENYDWIDGNCYGSKWAKIILDLRLN